MARKKKAEPVVAQVPATIEEVIVDAAPATVNVTRARTAWRTWGAPARETETGASAVVPAGMIFEGEFANNVAPAIGFLMHNQGDIYYGQHRGFVKEG